MTMAFGLRYACIGLLSICLSVVYSQTTESVESANATVEYVPPTIAEFAINVTHIESSTSSIKIAWTIPEGHTVQKYIVRSNRNGSEALTRSPDLDELEYIVEDLVTDEDYWICVIAFFVNGTSNYQVEECQGFETIRVIRDDSLIALFGVLAFIGLCILAGYLCWRYKYNKLHKSEDEEEDKVEKEGLLE